MSGISRQLIGEIPVNVKGDAYVKALNAKLSPESIANASGQCEQPIKNIK